MMHLGLTRARERRAIRLVEPAEARDAADRAEADGVAEHDVRDRRRHDNELWVRLDLSKAVVEMADAPLAVLKHALALPLGRCVVDVPVATAREQLVFTRDVP